MMGGSIMQTKLTIAAIVGALVTLPSFAADPTPAERKTVTSVNYVTNQIATRQAKIPVAGTNTSNTGTSVVMYTGTAGTIGERQIYSDSSSYTAGTDANKLVTAGALDYKANHLPTIGTSKLTCANSPDCTLWTIDDQTVYGNNSGNNGN